MTESLRIAVLLAGAEPDDVERTTIEFCIRGTAVDPIPVPRGRPVPAGVAATVTLAPDVELPSGFATMRLTDADGVNLDQSPAVLAAVTQGHDAVEVTLRDGLGSTLATGSVTTRRTHRMTVTQMNRVAGPLLVVAARSFPLPVTPPGLLPTTPSAATRAQRRHSKMAEVVRTARRGYEQAFFNRRWAVARVHAPGGLAGIRGGTGNLLVGPWCQAPGDDFWADPFIVDDSDQKWLYVEEMHRSVGRGVIRALQVTGDEVAPGPVVHQTQHHLSYPQLYRTPDRWLATVETCAAHNPIMTFDDLGGPWRESELPPLPRHLADPVLEFDGTAVCGVVGTDAQVDPDSVLVRYRLQPGTGAWIRDESAVRIDIRSTRGGGNLDVAAGIRATQDCAGDYGRAITLTQWPATDGTRVLGKIRGEQITPAPGQWTPEGVHTLTWTTGGKDPQFWCDGWHRQWTTRAWRLERLERTHLDVCRG